MPKIVWATKTVSGGPDTVVQPAPDVELAEVSFSWPRVIYKTVDLARPLFAPVKTATPC